MPVPCASAQHKLRCAVALTYHTGNRARLQRITPGGGSGMPKWLSDACGASGTGSQGAKGEPFKGDKSELNYCRSFDPVCKENASQPWYKLPDPLSAPGKSPVRAGDVEGRCSGDWTSGVIVDQIAIPADLKAGDYVLGWRWDCAHTMPAALRDCLVMPLVIYTITLAGLLSRCTGEETTQVCSTPRFIYAPICEILP